MAEGESSGTCDFLRRTRYRAIWSSIEEFPIFNAISSSRASPGASYGSNAFFISLRKSGQVPSSSPSSFVELQRNCAFQDLASPLFIKDNMYLIFFLLVLYVSLLTSRYR